MKKVIIIAAVCVAGMGAFLAALVVVTNVRGGLDPSRAGLKKVPLIGALVKVKPTPTEVEAKRQEAVAPADKQVPNGMSFLRFGAESRLTTLADELEAKKAEYDALLQESQRRARELEAWEKQLKVERDALRDKLEKEKEDLAAERTELDLKETELAAAQLKIDQNEAANLKATAAIYDKMAPEQAAAILTQMYSGDQQGTAVKIISLMQDRTAAKALESFTDAKVGAEITEQLQRIAKPTKAGG